MNIKILEEEVSFLVEFPAGERFEFLKRINVDEFETHFKRSSPKRLQGSRRVDPSISVWEIAVPVDQADRFREELLK